MLSLQSVYNLESNETFPRSMAEKLQFRREALFENTTFMG